MFIGRNEGKIENYLRTEFISVFDRMDRSDGRSTILQLCHRRVYDLESDLTDEERLGEYASATAVRTVGSTGCPRRSRATAASVVLEWVSEAARHVIGRGNAGSGEYERRDGGDGSREALSAGGYQHTRRETAPPAT